MIDATEDEDKVGEDDAWWCQGYLAGAEGQRTEQTRIDAHWPESEHTAVHRRMMDLGREARGY